ncbi:MAG: DNA polymerase/3'-5' exonuclease PolX [bacterium]
MKNREIAEIFDKLGDILEFKTENRFKINAYRKAALILRDLTEDVAVLAAENRLRDIQGIGEGIEKKIIEYLDTGKMRKFEEEKQGVPSGIFELLSIAGVGPKTVAKLYREQGIETVKQLETAIQQGKLRDIAGMGEKKEENILHGIQLLREGSKRISLGIAVPLVAELIEKMQQTGTVSQIDPAGSMRRMKETIGDIDILATGKSPDKIIQAFTTLPMVKEILAAGETKASVRVENNLQVDLRVVARASYGAALQYFTGSKAHNIKIRDIAKRQGLKINEYGVFQGEKLIAGKTESEVYATLNLPLIPPELREDRGEIEAATENHLPNLVELKDIKGDLQMHSAWSDGANTLEDIAAQAQKFGYEYIAITDHSSSLKVAGGLSPQKVVEQIGIIRSLNKKLKGVTLLAGSEVDIKSDGSLDFPDEILQELDIVLAAIHTGFKQDEKTVTNRIISAMRNPLVNIIVHPTGRLIGVRDSYAVDLDAVMQTAKDTGTILEINAYYQRLDLNDVYARKAQEMGIILSLGTDSHHIHQFWMMQLGVGIARRGWVTKRNILNTYTLSRLKSSLKPKKSGV